MEAGRVDRPGDVKVTWVWQTSLQGEAEGRGISAIWSAETQGSRGPFTLKQDRLGYLCFLERAANSKRTPLFQTSQEKSCPNSSHRGCAKLQGMAALFSSCCSGSWFLAPTLVYALRGLRCVEAQCVGSGFPPQWP